MKILFFILLLLFFFLHDFKKLYSQERSESFYPDSVKISTPKLIRPQIKFDTRTTIYEEQKVNMFGYEVGILIKNKLRMTLGYYRIDDNLPKPKETKTPETEQNIYLRAGTINTELVYFTKRFLSLGFPLEIGTGYYRIKNTPVVTSAEINHLEGIVAFSNFGLAATFTPIRWFGLKVIGGYRKAVLSSNKKFDFNGVFSSIGLNIDMQEIIKDIKMYQLKKQYVKRGISRLETFTDLMVD